MSGQARLPLRTTLPDGNRVSTVRLPLRHLGGWYETMVFSVVRAYEELDMRRAETEEQARINHAAMVAKWSATEESKR